MIHGECFDVMATLADQSIDVCITDPPYSKHVHASVRSAKRTKLPDVEEYECRTRRTVDLGFEYLAPKLRRACAFEYARLTKRWTMAFSDVESCHLWRLSLITAGFDYVRTMEWIRLNGAPQFTGDRPASSFEAITLVHPKGRKRWNGGGKQGRYTFPIVQNRGGNNPRNHTTEKPLELMMSLIEDFTDPGDLVLDSFAGSGTTGLACLRLGRRFLGIEQKEEHFQTCVERLTAESAGTTVRATRAGQESLFGNDSK